MIITRNQAIRYLPLTVLLLLVALVAFGESPQNSKDVSSLPSVSSQAQFDTLSVVYDANTPYALPHVLFVIDRQHNNRIYYVNTKLYKFHKDFVNGTYLSLERGQA